MGCANAIECQCRSTSVESFEFMLVEDNAVLVRRGNGTWHNGIVINALSAWGENNACRVSPIAQE
jgi:hypothetical protein